VASATDVPVVADVPDEARPSPTRGRRVLHALAPAGIYVAVRLVGVAVLGLMAGFGRLPTALNAWDGTWMVAIARYGYDVPDDMLDAFGNHTPDTAKAFFPGYPALVATTGWLTGGNLILAGLVVSLVAGIVAAYGLTRLGELVPGGSRRAGLLLVGLFAAAPMGVVLSMTYTEALFCAFTAWALVGVLRRQWVAAGACTLAAGLVRPTATALIAAVGLAALVAVIKHRDGWRPWVGGILAPCGVLGYLAYVALATGQLDGWSRIQRAGWSSYLDGGVSTAAFTGDALADGSEVYDLAIVLGAGRKRGAARRRDPGAAAVAARRVRGARARARVVLERPRALQAAAAGARVHAAAARGDRDWRGGAPARPWPWWWPPRSRPPGSAATRSRSGTTASDASPAARPAWRACGR
jgi:hypothetical protein